MNFLESLRKSSEFFEISLVVTQWHERGVRKALEDSGVEFHLLDLDEVIPYCRYSLSTVLVEGLKRSEDATIVYTTCDVELTPDFFSRVELDLSDGSMLIPFPYREVNYVQDQRFKGDEKPNAEIIKPTGIDVFVFSNEAAKKLESSAFFERYRFLGWGMFDHLLILACIQNRIPIINISGINLTLKYHNDRLQNGETSSWMESTHKLNTLYFKRYVGLRIRFLRLLKMAYLIEVIKTNEVNLQNVRFSEIFLMIINQVKIVVTFSKSSRALLQSLPME